MEILSISAYIDHEAFEHIRDSKSIHDLAVNQMLTMLKSKSEDEIETPTSYQLVLVWKQGEKSTSDEFDKIVSPVIEYVRNHVTLENDVFGTLINEHNSPFMLKKHSVYARNDDEKLIDTARYAREIIGI